MSAGPSITARLGLDTAAFSAGIPKAASSREGFAGKLGISLGVGAVVAFGKSVMGMAGNLQDASDNLNINVESLQELEHAFAQGGVSSEQFEKGLTKLNQSIQSAREGNKAAIATFEKMGVSWDDLHTKSPDEILMLMADAAKNSTDPVGTLTSLTELLGKAGAKMAGGMRQGADELSRLGQEAAKLNEADVKAIADLGDSADTLWKKIQVGGAHTGLFLRDVFNSVYDGIGQWQDPGMGAQPENETSRRVAEQKARRKAGQSKPVEAVPKSPAEAAAEDQRAFEQKQKAKFLEDDKNRIEELGEFERRQKMQFVEEEKRRIEEIGEAERKQKNLFLADQEEKAKAAKEAGDDMLEHARQMKVKFLELQAEDREKAIDEKLKSPEQRREDRRVKNQRERTGRAIDKNAAGRELTDSKNARRRDIRLPSNTGDKNVVSSPDVVTAITEVKTAISNLQMVNLP